MNDGNRFKQINIILMSTDINANQKTLLCILWKFADSKTGHVWSYPSQKKIKKLIGIKSDTTYYEILNSLVDKKVITINRKKKNFYRINYDILEKLHGNSPETGEFKLDLDSPETGDYDSPETGDYDSPETGEQKEKKNKNKTYIYIDSFNLSKLLNREIEIKKIKLTPAHVINLIKKYGETLVSKKILELDYYVFNGEGYTKAKCHDSKLEQWCERGKGNCEQIDKVIKKRNLLG